MLASILLSVTATSLAENQHDPREDVIDGLDDLSFNELEKPTAQIHDMMFTKDGLHDYLGLGDTDRNAIYKSYMFWKNGLIPYKIHDSMPSYLRTKIRSFTKRFNKRMEGCVKLE